MIFDIVNQLDRGASLITSRQERDQIAELNLIAGKRAKASAAYASALKYFVAGSELLLDDAWERQRELSFALHLHRSECEFLAGEMATAADRLTMLSFRAANTVEKATVACLRVDLYTSLNQSDRAVAVCLDYLRDVGVEWSPHPSAEEARLEYERIWERLGSRAIEELLELALMSDPTSLATLDVLTKVLPPAQFTDANLFSLAICRAVNLSLERGNSDSSCVAYVWLGMIAGPYFGNYQAGFRFGQLGFELVEKHGLKRFQARIYTCFGSQIMPWTKHVRAGRDLLRRTFEAANKSGDLTFAAYSCHDLNRNLLATGDPLAEVQCEAENGLEFAQKAQFGLVIDTIIPQLGLVRTLRGLTSKFGSFDNEEFDELLFEQHLASRPVLALPECWYWIRKLQARFFAGDYASAVNATLKARELLWTSPSFFETAEYHFYGGLSHAACCDSASSDGYRHSSSEGLTKEDLSSEALAKEEHFEALAAHHRQLQEWSESCPENFENRAALVGAEIARIESRVPDAMDLYERAIRSAQANGFVHNEALANELTARFYLVRGFEKIGRTYLREARNCYLRWGATAKVRQLDELYPHLTDKEPALGSTSTIGASVGELDLTTVVKALQTLSGEIDLEKLIDTLMRMVIEHAAAQRGLLILGQGEDQRIKAEATTNADSIIVDVRTAPVTGTALPESIVRYVNRTKENVILDDASMENRFSEDDYLRERHSKSVLCLPLVKQATLTGLLYLENSLTPRVFTSGRLAVLELLASQAAISLDNARLYSDLAQLNVELTQENSDRRRAEEALRASEQRLQDIIDNTSAVIFVKDLELRYLLVNREFERRHNVRREEIRGKDDFDIHPYGVAEEVRGNDAQVIRAGAPIHFEEVVPSEQGNRCYICAKFPLRDRNGKPYAVCGIATDITEHKQAENALQQAQAEIARASRMTTIEQLAASIAHEVNQPLAAVVTSGNACLNWLATSPPNLRKAREAVERMVRDGNRASDVLKRVRALMRKAPLVKSPVNLNEVIQEVLTLLAGELRKQSVELSTELGLNLPAVIGDFVQLQQVLLNLVMNAIESMANTTRRPRAIHIQSRLDDNAGRSGVLVAVRDSGVGLSPEEVVQVFEAFYSTKPEGMGMGLWICRSIIEVHGGQLTARPNEAGGATFQFVLPSSTKERA
jgi:PAS domain S-box-containing protein